MHKNKKQMNDRKKDGKNKSQKIEANKIKKTTPIEEEMIDDKKRITEWMRTNKFRGIINLLKSSVSHEIGNSFNHLINGLRIFKIESEEEKNEIIELARKGYHYYYTIFDEIEAVMEDNYTFEPMRFERNASKIQETLKSIATKYRKIMDEFENKEDAEYNLFHVDRLEEFTNIMLVVLKELIINTDENNKTYLPTIKISLETIKKKIVEETRNFYMSIEIDMEEDEGKIKVNPFVLKCAIKNIIQNAKQAIEKNNGRRHLKVKIYIDKKDGMACIEFEDKGAGMDEETMDKLNSGEPIAKRKNRKNKKYPLPYEISEINGIGFNYSKKLVESNFGEMYIKRTEKRKGTTVMLKLPIDL